MAEKTALERCYDIMDWINANPNVRRRHYDIAKGLDISEAMVNKIVNRDFPQCFGRVARVGVGLTGIMPEKGEFVARKIAFKWDPEVMAGLNKIWRAATDENVITDLRTTDKDGAEFIQCMGEHLSELAKQLIEAKVIGSEAQKTWRPE